MCTKNTLNVGVGGYAVVSIFAIIILPISSTKCKLNSVLREELYNFAEIIFAVVLSSFHTTESQVLSIIVETSTTSTSSQGQSISWSFS